MYIRNREKSKLMQLLTVLVLITSVSAQENGAPELPLSVPDDQIRPLRKLVDKKLQKKLEDQLKKNKEWWKLIDRRRMTVGVVDLSDISKIKFARVNGNRMLYAASLPKLAILLASEQALEDSLIEDTPEIRHDMRIMISQSDNFAATRMFDRVGGTKYIESVLRKPEYELYNPNFGGGLWVGKRFAKGGKRYPDPVMGTSHGATATQVCRFYYLLAMGKLINRERSKEMLDILSDPEIHHKFVNTLDRVAPDATVYRKSGSWKNWHSDSVMVWGPVWRRYILVALIDDPRGEQICRDLIPVIEDMLQSQTE